MRHLPLVAALIVLSATTFARADTRAFQSAEFDAVRAERGVVLVSVNWGRRWGCGAYQNAQLQELQFDSASTAPPGPEAPADIQIEVGSALFAGNGFRDYALMVKPGEYAMSGFRVKVAKSVSDVGYFKADRAALFEDGKSKAGSFSVGAGEIVYIGHFGLDCASDPTPWRYYPGSKADFAKYLDQIGKEFPGLVTSDVVFRLFQTTSIGRPFSLD